MVQQMKGEGMTGQAEKQARNGAKEKALRMEAAQGREREAALGRWWEMKTEGEKKEGYGTESSGCIVLLPEASELLVSASPDHAVCEDGRLEVDLSL
jgi:hypothetical protein